MKKLADIKVQDNQIHVSGDLCFANVMSVYHKSLKYFSQTDALQFDFSNVTSSDSAGLALIVEWIKQAKTRRKIIHFSAIPESLLALATAAGMLELISN